MSSSPLFVGTCAYRHVAPATTSSMLALAMSDTPPAGMIVSAGYGACANLETVVQAALDSVGVDGLLLYHDADIVYAPDDVQRIVNAWEARAAFSRKRTHVLGALYPTNSDERVCVGHPLSSKPAPECGAMADSSQPVWATLWPCDRLGFGFILIPLAAYVVIGKPYAREEWDGRDYKTQDTIFCERVERAGYDLWGVPDLNVRHLVTQELSFQDTRDTWRRIRES